MGFLRLHHRAPHLGSGLPIEKQKNPLVVLGKEKPVPVPSSLGGDCRACEAPKARQGGGRLKRDAQSWPESRWDSLLFWDSFPDSSSRVRTRF